MTPSDSSGNNKRAGGVAALSGVDRLFGRDLRSKGWVLKLAPISEPQATETRATETRETESAPEADPAMIWALRWRRR
jgi:hypothetical protein